MWSRRSHTKSTLPKSGTRRFLLAYKTLHTWVCPINCATKSLTDCNIWWSSLPLPMTASQRRFHSSQALSSQTAFWAQYHELADMTRSRSFGGVRWVARCPLLGASATSWFGSDSWKAGGVESAGSWSPFDHWFQGGMLWYAVESFTLMPSRGQKWFQKLEIVTFEMRAAHSRLKLL